VNWNVFALTLDSQEKKYLEGLLETDLKETCVEVRRTDAPDLHDELLSRERMIHNLLKRLQTNNQPESSVPGRETAILSGRR
jgi:hypothetical protein